LTASITDAHSGVASSSMSVDGGVPQAGAPLQFAADGQYQVIYNAADHAGNAAVPVTENIRVDQTPPLPIYDLVVASDSFVNGWYNKPVGVAAMSTDATSGIATDNVELDSSGTWAPHFAITTSGVHTVNQQVVDAAGNLAGAGPDTIRVDLDRPAMQIILGPSRGQAASKAEMDFVGNSVDRLSGLQSVAYQVDGGTWQTVTVLPSGDWAFQVNTEPLDNGLRTIVIRTTDTAGNIASWQVDVDVHNPDPVPQAPILRIFANPTATPLPSPTPTLLPSPTPVVEINAAEEAAPAAPVTEFNPTAMPTAAPTPVIYNQVQKQAPVNVAVAISALPFLGVLTAVAMLYDPRPKQLNKLVHVTKSAAPDRSALKEVISFIGTTLLPNHSDQGEN